MSLSPRAIALQGIGFQPSLIAVQGLGPTAAPVPVLAQPQRGAARLDRGRRGRFPELPRELVPPVMPDPNAPALPRRRRRRKEAEWLLLQQ